MRHKKCIRKLLSFLTILCCLAGSIMPVLASGAGSGSDAVRVVFTNEPVNSPDLYVTKVVENAVDGAEYAAPEHAAYRFVLKLDGQVAKNVTYRVLDAEHGEILCRTSMGMNVPFQTDRTGVFTLEAGQQAWFEGTGTGSRYEVIEQSTYLLPKTDADGNEVTVPGGYVMYCMESGAELHREYEYETRSLTADGFQIKSPVGGSTGEHSVLVNGSYETFTNRYTGKGTGETTRLEITKTVSFPEGYQAPDDTPDFPFVIELDGSPCANEPFTAENRSTGEIRSMITDGSGRFFLQGGWTAVFEKAPVDVDYKVYEDTESLSGWWPVQDTIQTGATRYPLTALNFHNANVSFVVTKRLEDYSRPDDIEFWFRLADENNDALAGITYYLYNTTGEPVWQDSDAMERPLAEYPGQENLQAGPEALDVRVNGRPIVTGETSSYGLFRLKPGQAAVFMGLEPGTSYRVTETKNPSYTQVLPLPTADSLHTVPADGQITTVDFVNRPESAEGVLTVTKDVYYETQEGELSEDEFHFVLYRRLTEDETAKTVGGTSEADLKTGLAEGRIVLAKLPDDFRDMEEAEGDEALLSLIPSAPGVNDPFSGLPDGWAVEIDGEQYAVCAPAEEMLFCIPEGLEAPTYRTGPYPQTGWTQPGEFALKAGQTARFEDKIQAGDQYFVREIGLTEEYEEVQNGMYYEMYTAWPGESEAASAVFSQAGTVFSPGGLALDFQNSYRPRKINLQLTKTDGEDQPITDREAHFMLYRTSGKESPVLPEGADADTFVYKTENGVLQIPDLKAGTYWLCELKAPSGYCLLPEPVEISLLWTEDGLSVTIDGRTFDAGNPDAVKGGAIGGVAVNPADGEVNAAVCLSIRNTELYELPSSGGIGIYWYSIGGTLLMLAAVLILYRYQRRGRC